jgi:hypothetical protein
VTVLTQATDCVELGAVQFVWFVETWGFHFAGKLGVSTLQNLGQLARNLGFPADLGTME